MYVKWPQKVFYTGAARTRVKYDNLTQSQWASGVTRVLQLETNQLHKTNMGQYMADLFQDLADYGFECAKGAHAVILSQIEEGNLTWSNPEQIAHVRRSHNSRAQACVNSYGN